MRKKIMLMSFAITMLVSASMTTTSYAATTSRPVVGSVSPTAATANTALVLSAAYSDPEGVATCSLYIDNINKGSMTLTGSFSSGTASYYYVFPSATTYRAQVKCTDRDGNLGTGAVTNVNVTAIAPTVSAVSPESVVVNVSQMYSAYYSDVHVVNSCTLYADGQQAGSMTIGSSNSGTATLNHTFTTTGSHTLQVRCTDVNGDIGQGTITTIYVASTGLTDTSPPTVPANFRQRSISASNTATFVWDPSSDNVGVDFYAIAIDNGSYNFVGTNTSYTTNVLTNGMHYISVRAHDSAGNMSAPVTRSFFISAIGPTVNPLYSLSLEQFFTDARMIEANNDNRSEFESSTGMRCELSELVAESRVKATLGNISNQDVRTSIENFVACGTRGSLYLGSGERLGVVNSFLAAYGRLPQSQSDWNDVLKIANGRFPDETSATAEARAKSNFKVVFKRDANVSRTEDNNAIVVMAYGLRPLPRNLNSEAAAITTFRAVYGLTPSTATDWDIVRAVAYSGATR